MMRHLDSSPSRQEAMIQRQIVERGITSERLLEALRSVPRDRFFAHESTSQAFADNAAPIGYGQTISQPFIVALMTDRLEVEPHHRVLEIGTGSGYQTAVLARLAREVYSIERVKPLLDQAFERLSEMNFRNVRFRHGDGSNGWPEAAPFDRILIAAGAPALPESMLQSQLVAGGIAVLPIGPEDQQMLVRVQKKGDRLISSDVCPVRFVKLVGDQGWTAD